MDMEVALLRIAVECHSHVEVSAAVASNPLRFPWSAAKAVSDMVEVPTEAVKWNRLPVSVGCVGKSAKS